MAAENKSTSIDQEIGRRIWTLRGARTPQEVADAIGVSREVYNHWEAGTRHIKAEHIAALARYYDVTADFLLGLPTPLVPSEEERRQVALAYTGLTEAALDMLQLLQEIPLTGTKRPARTVRSIHSDWDMLIRLLESDDFFFIIHDLAGLLWYSSAARGDLHYYSEREPGLLTDEELEGLYDTLERLGYMQFKLSTRFSSVVDSFTQVSEVERKLDEIMRETNLRMGIVDQNKSRKAEEKTNATTTKEHP